MSIFVLRDFIEFCEREGIEPNLRHIKVYKILYWRR